jgi:hypothetical protein
MPGMMKKSPTPKPKASPMAKPKATVTPKAKATPAPKFTAPTLAEYKSSAAYRAGDLTYKQYIAATKNAFDIRNKKK